jgi:L-arabinose isomerase
LRSEVSELEIDRRLANFLDTFDIQSDCSTAELERAARTSGALDHLVEWHNLGSMAYYYSGSGNPANDDAINSIILSTSLLTARGIPVAGECEVKNAQAMKIMDAFGAGGSFSEYYAVDFTEDVVLMRHDGPGHLAIAAGKIKVRPLKVYHGKMGRGLSVEMSVKHGPVTLLSVVKSAGRLKLLTAEADAVPGPILELGNRNSRYRFSICAGQFVNAWTDEGPAHYCAIGIGHVAARIERLGAVYWGLRRYEFASKQEPWSLRCKRRFVASIWSSYLVVERVTEISKQPTADSSAGGLVSRSNAPVRLRVF